MEVVWLIKKISSDDDIISYVRNLDNSWLDFDEFKYLAVCSVNSGMVMFRVTNHLMFYGPTYPINIHYSDLVNDMRDKLLNDILNK